MRCCSWLLALAALAPLQGVEYALPERPEDVAVQPVDGRPQVVVRWGRVSETLSRHPSDLRREQQLLIQRLTGPEAMAIYRQRARAIQDLALVAGDLQMLKMRVHRQSEPHATYLAAQQEHSQRVLPLTLGMSAIPLRRVQRYVLFDQRDPAQTAWLVAWAQAPRLEQADIVYAIGYTSEQAIVTLTQQLRPWLPMGIDPLRAGDLLASELGVTALPAIVTTTPDDQLLVRQGLALDPVPAPSASGAAATAP
jgi:hypothetical protein